MRKQTHFFQSIVSDLLMEINSVREQNSVQLSATRLAKCLISQENNEKKATAEKAEST